MMAVVKNIVGPNPREFTSQERNRPKYKSVYLKGTALKVGLNLGNMIQFQKLKQCSGEVPK